MAERRLRKTVDPVRGKRLEYRIRATFDRTADRINDVDPTLTVDPRLPLYQYLARGWIAEIEAESVPDIPA